MEEKIKHKLEKLNQRYAELQSLLLQKEIFDDPVRLSQYAKEFNEVKEKLSLFFEFKKIENEINKLEPILKEKHEAEFLKLAEEEYERLKTKYNELENRITEFFNKEETKDIDKDIIMEIRAGTGGLEASLFAADLYRIYTKYADRKSWKVEFISSHPTELGGFKEIIFGIKGKDAYNRLRFESGVHRVQRIPVTETGGRIHTSTATVAVLKEPDRIEIEIDSKDLRIDVFRSSGPGGQSVNTTDSAVRITHLPTGMVVTCQDERSQLKNKNKAMRVLRARLLEMKNKEQIHRISSTRKTQIGTGERSEKIRTYNFPDRRVTDHRIDLTVYRLEEIMDGNLDLIIEPLLQKEASFKDE